MSGPTGCIQLRPRRAAPDHVKKATISRAAGGQLVCRVGRHAHRPTTVECPRIACARVRWLYGHAHRRARATVHPSHRDHGRRAPNGVRVERRPFPSVTRSNRAAALPTWDGLGVAAARRALSPERGVGRIARPRGQARTSRPLPHAAPPPAGPTIAPNGLPISCAATDRSGSRPSRF
jgi:hypothetical protein